MQVAQQLALRLPTCLQQSPHTRTSKDDMKAAFQILVGFIVYAAVGAVEAGLVLVALSEGDRYVFYFVYIFAPFAGLCCGLVGIAATYLIQRDAYRWAAWLTIVAFLAVACAMAAILLAH